MRLLERLQYDRLVSRNYGRVAQANDAELLQIMAWLIINEPHVLRDALDEIGLEK